VSTAKQGEHGVSLQEQRDAIARYAHQNQLEIASWYEERVTAAKRGRPIFNQMLKQLRHGKASGVIIHKIDRGARNLKDWADLGELIDQGVEVQFVNESLDLHSRGGRLSADIQAVVAADYIRNLREETRKGFYGRIKQGLYPLPAPLGYLDRGKGKTKELDPAKAVLVKKTFELYATGKYSLDVLADETFRLGLRNRTGNKITRNGLAVLLKNPFYFGLIRLKRSGETFPGSHKPLISKSVFDRVQRVLQGKAIGHSQTHDFLLRRLLSCMQCKHSLIGEKQKGHVYYRCHARTCLKTCVREEAVHEVVLQQFSLLMLNKQEQAYGIKMLRKLQEDSGKHEENVRQALQLSLAQGNDRLRRLTDAYLDKLIDKDAFEERRATLLMERKNIEERIEFSNCNRYTMAERVEKFLELAGSAYSLYKSGLPDERRHLLQTVTSNRQVQGKNIEFTLALPFNELANRFQNTNGAPYRARPRTLERLFSKLITYFKDNPAPLTGSESDFMKNAS